MAKTNGLADVIAAETELSLVDGQQGNLLYRGVPARKLAVDYRFEEVAYLIWYGRLPNDEEREQLEEQLQIRRKWTQAMTAMIDALPADLDLMSVLRTVISGMGKQTYVWPPTIDQAITLTAIAPTVIAYRYRKNLGLPPIEPHDNLRHVANYLYMLTGQVAGHSHVRALEAYFILTLEHGMNASTFASRVISSTESDLVSAVTGAIGAMKGPLHGGAPTGVIDMLNEIQSPEQATDWIRTVLERGEKLMGFGHRVYKTEDPRACALRDIVKQLAGEDPWLNLAYHVEQEAVRLLEEYKPGRKLYANVEFYAAAVMRALEMPAVLFTPTFTASRIVGWTAHVLEQAANNRLIRPQSKYVGHNAGF